MTNENYLKEHICPICHIGILEPHPETIKWNKCPICGYSAKEPKEENIKNWRMLDNENKSTEVKIGVPTRDTNGRKL